MAYTIYVDTNKDVRGSIVRASDANITTFPNTLVFADNLPVEVQFVSDNEVVEFDSGTCQLSVGLPGSDIYAYVELMQSASSWVGTLNLETVELNTALSSETFINAYLQVTYTNGSTLENKTYAQVEIPVFNNVISSSIVPSNLPQYLTVSESDARYLQIGDNVSGSFWIQNSNFVYTSNDTYSVGIGTSTPDEKLEVVGNIKSTGIISAGNYVTGTFIGRLTGTSSFAVTASNADTSSVAVQAISASYALSSSNSVTASYTLETSTASFAVTSSFALVATDATYSDFCISADNALSASYTAYTDTASFAYNARTASYAISTLNNATASYSTTSSFGFYAMTASYAATSSYSISNVTNVTQSSVISASYASSSRSASLAELSRTSSLLVGNASTVDLSLVGTNTTFVYGTTALTASSKNIVITAVTSSTIEANNDINLNTYSGRTKVNNLSATGSLFGTASYIIPRTSVFNTINQLATSTYPFNSDELIYVKGYYTASDWGSERKARYNPTSALSPNNGTIFTSSNGGQFIFEDVSESVHNIKWYGAKGDGVTDDYSAIAAAISASNHLEIPLGRYKHTQAIVIRTNEPISIKSKTGAYQSGYLSYSNIKEAEFVYSGSMTTASFDITSTNLRYGNDLENVSFDANGKSLYGLKVGNAARGKFNCVRANGAIDSNLFLSSSQFCEFDRFSTSINDDVPTVSYPSRYGVKLDGFSPCNTFIQSTIENSTVYGLYLGRLSLNNNFIGGAIESNTGGGIYISASCKSNNFENIWFENNHYTASNILVDYQAYFNSFRNIYFNDSGSRIDVSGSYNTFETSQFGIINISNTGTRNVWSNVVYGFALNDSSSFSNNFINVINAAASVRRDEIASALYVKNAVTASSFGGGPLLHTASYARTASFIGSGSNNYLPKWSGNTLTYNSLIHDDGTKLTLGGGWLIQGGTTSLPTYGELFGGWHVTNGGWSRGMGWVSGSNVQAMIGAYGNGSTGTLNYLFFGSGSSVYQNPWMVITDSGNVGIGTTAPATKLHVVGQISSSGITSSLFGSASYAINTANAVSALTASYVGSGTNNYFPKWSGNSFTATSSIYDNNTNVGVGTTSPTAKIHVLANDTLLKLQRSDAPTQYLNLVEDGNGHGIFAYSPNSNRKILTIGTTHSVDGTSSGAGYIYFNTSGSTRLWIDETGNVLPFISNSYDLGSSTKTWKNVYGANFIGTASIATTASYSISSSRSVLATNSTTSSYSLVAADADLLDGFNSTEFQLALTTGSLYTITSSWANNSLTASYFGSGSNNYLPKWSGNRLTYNSLINDDTVKLTLGGGWLIQGNNTALDTHTELFGAWGVTPSGWARGMGWVSGSFVQAMIGAYGNGSTGTLNYIYFGSGSSVYQNPWMVITNAGDVGIGTTSPSTKLHVAGQISSSGITSSLFGTSSRAISGSYAVTSSYAVNAATASLAVYANNSDLLDGLNSAEFQLALVTGNSYSITSSWANNSVSASYAPGSPTVSASYAVNASTASLALFANNSDLLDGYNSAEFQLALVTGNSYSITSSWSNNSLTASYYNQRWLNTGSNYPITASWANAAIYAQDADHAIAADEALGATYATSAGTAGTASYVLNAVSSSFATRAVNSQTASLATYANNSDLLDGLNSAEFQLALITGNTYSITSSWSNNSVTASYFNQRWLNTGSSYPITSSWANNSISASYAPSSPSVSASYATTASYAITAGTAVTAAYASNADTLDGFNSGEFQLDLPQNGNEYLITCSYAANVMDSANVPSVVWSTKTQGAVSASVGNEGSFTSILGTVRSGITTPIPAGVIDTGDVLRIEAMGTMYAEDGYDFDLKIIVGNLICTFDVNEAFSYNAYTTVWNLRADVVINTSGTSATVIPTAFFDHVAEASSSANYNTYRSCGQWSGTLNTEDTISLDLQYKPIDSTKSKTMACRSFTAQIL